MAAEDEATTAVVRIGAQVITSTLDIIKYLLQMVLGQRGYGRSSEGSFVRQGIHRLAEGVSGVVHKGARALTKDIDGTGLAGEVSWRRAAGFDDADTVALENRLNDPENLEELRETLKRFDIDFAIKEVEPGGDILIGYHVKDRRALDAVVMPLLQKWAQEKGMDPKALQEGLVREGFARDPGEANALGRELEAWAMRPATQGQLDALFELVDSGDLTLDEIGRLGAEPTMGGVCALLDGHSLQNINAAQRAYGMTTASLETQPSPKTRLVPRDDCHELDMSKGIRQRTEEARARGPEAVFAAAAADADRDALEAGVGLRPDAPTQGMPFGDPGRMSGPATGWQMSYLDYMVSTGSMSRQARDSLGASPTAADAARLLNAYAKAQPTQGQPAQPRGPKR